MNIFGLTIARRKDAPAGLRSINDRRAWWPIIREANTGDWQRNLEARVEDAFQHAIAWACMTLIAGDIGKLRIRLVQSDANGVTTEISNPAYSPFLRKPNRYQNRIQFFEYWILSKLSRGNTYVLKARDSRGVVIAGYILDPSRVRVLVAVDGSVFYQLDADNLSGLPTSVVVPAREIFHDTMYTLYHPLVGVSPIYACGASVLQGLKIVANSSELFENGSQLSGVLTAPGLISQDNADRIREHWEQNFAGWTRHRG
jgi:HK97 family phage portal protein